MSKSHIYLVFGVIPMIAASVYYFSSQFIGMAYVSWLWWIVVFVVIDWGHIFSTLPVYLERCRKTPFGVYGAILIPPLIVSSSFFLALYSSRALVLTVAYITIFHLVRQQMGLLKISLANNFRASENEKKLHLLVMRVVMIFAVLHFHSYASQSRSYYFTQGDIIRFLPAFPFEILTPLLSVAFLLFLVWSYWRAKRTSAGFELVALQFGTFVWFFGGWIYLSEAPFFWILAPLMHSLPYMFLAWSTSPSRRFALPAVAIYMVWVIFAVPWLSPNLNHQEGIYGAFLLGLFWSPGMIHFAVDGMIWKKSVVAS